MTLKEPAAEISANLEYPACPLCECDRRGFPFRLHEPYEVARCIECGFHYLYPRLIESAMQEVYRESSYYEGGACGYADTSYTFKRRVGTEFSPEGGEIARATGAEVFVGGIEQVPPEAKFDCVVGTQLIEHVYEPLSFVKRLAGHTRPGGHIILATPDIGGVLRKLMGRRWPSFKVPEHVLYFDPRTLSSLMLRAGLSNVRRLPYPHAFPLGLIAAKFGFKLPPWLGHFNVWVPATTVAAYGRVTNA